MKEERCNVAVYEPQLQMGLRTCEFTRGHTSVKYFVTLDTLMKKISVSAHGKFHGGSPEPGF